MRTEVPTATRPGSPTPTPTFPPEGPGPWARAAAGALAIGLILWALLLPLWEARLLAPQYPDGLRVTAFGDRVIGDLAEINGLNHYVGMRPFEMEAFPELRLGLWLPTIILAALAALLATIGGRRWWARLARLGVWSVPLGVLAIIQLRLFQLGHDLDPAAPLRIEPFTPWVIGRTKVWNFTTWSFPGWGLAVIVAAAAILSFGPRMLQRIGRLVAPAAVGMLAVLLLAPGALAHPGHGSVEAAGSELALRLAGAEPGETVVVPPGIHRGNFVVDVPLTLEGADGAVLDGGGRGTVLTIEAADVTVRTLTIRGSGPGPVEAPAGIEVHGPRAAIEGVTVEDAYMGIAVRRAPDVRIEGSTIRGRPGAKLADDGHAASGDEERGTGPSSGRGDAVSLHEANGALLRDNRIHDARDGVFVLFGSDALIDRNTVTGSRYAVHSMYAQHLAVSENRFESNLAGIVLMYGGPALVLGNTVMDQRSPSTGFGLLLKDVEGLEAARNVLVGNRVGIQVEGPAGDPRDTRVILNTVALNEAGLALFPSARAAFAGNSFVANTTEVLALGEGVAGKNYWSDQGAGNFWGSYRGFGSRDDDIGDVAHQEGGAVDGLISREPLLSALASSPAFRLLSALEDRWVQAEPVVTDEIPLLRPLSPPLETDGTRSAPAMAAGAGLLTLAALVLFREAGSSRWGVRRASA